MQRSHLGEEKSESIPVIEINEVDFYKILNIQSDATIEEIKKSYRNLALIYHPDKKPHGNEEIFKKINEAYYILSNPSLRHDYDHSSDTEKQKFATTDDAEEKKGKKNTFFLKRYFLLLIESNEYEYILDFIATLTSMINEINAQLEPIRHLGNVGGEALPDALKLLHMYHDLTFEADELLLKLLPACRYTIAMLDPVESIDQIKSVVKVFAQVVPEECFLKLIDMSWKTLQLAEKLQSQSSSGMKKTFHKLLSIKDHFSSSMQGWINYLTVRPINPFEAHKFLTGATTQIENHKALTHAMFTQSEDDEALTKTMFTQSGQLCLRKVINDLHVPLKALKEAAHRPLNPDTSRNEKRNCLIS